MHERSEHLTGSQDVEHTAYGLQGNQDESPPCTLHEITTLAVRAKNSYQQAEYQQP